MSATTVRGWIRKGKRDPEGEFGAFAIEPEAPSQAPMTHTELERHVVEVIRARKSVGAMALWARLHPQDAAADLDDPFAEFQAFR